MKFQELQVFYDTGCERALVGTIALADREVLFEYDAAWKKRGIELAPLKMPLSPGAYRFKQAELPGELPGLCADSLPDGWGLLIMDRFFARQGVSRRDITPLDRLAYLGDHAMGALAYSPSTGCDSALESIEIGKTAREAYDVFEGNIEDASKLLAKIGGSPGGARPKALIGISDDGRRFVTGSGALPEGYSHWLVKFSSPQYGKLSMLGPYEGAVESIYLEMASKAGITVPLYTMIADDGLAHIAVRRFDRPAGNRRMHMSTVCGLLHADHRLPSLDYQELVKLAWAITRDSRQVQEQFRRAVFNLLAVNRDDHSKNHGYVLGDDGKWRLSPAYDLTFCLGHNEEHWTSYLGIGSVPNRKQLLELAAKGSISAKDASVIVDGVAEAVASFPEMCKEREVPVTRVKLLIAEQERVRKAVG